MRKVLARSRKEVGKCQSRDTGGTGQAISVASENDIPVYNMANPDWYIRLYEMHEINLYDIVNDTQPG
jgi:hypothetical protein